MNGDRRFVAALAVVLISALAGPAQTASDRDLVKGIRQVEDGYLEDAATTLEAVASRLSNQPAAVGELALAYLYLGIAYAQMDTEKAAQAMNSRSRSAQVLVARKVRAIRSMRMIGQGR